MIRIGKIVFLAMMNSFCQLDSRIILPLKKYNVFPPGPMASKRKGLRGVGHVLQIRLQSSFVLPIDYKSMGPLARRSCACSVKLSKRACGHCSRALPTVGDLPDEGSPELPSGDQGQLLLGAFWGGY